MKSDELLILDNLSATYKLPRGLQLTAVANVSFVVYKGETLGLVGESGCGKSTVGRSIMQLPPPTGGTVIFQGHDLASLNAGTLRRIQTRLHMIFQYPNSSLNPRRKVRDIVAEPMAIAGVGTAQERVRRVRIALEAVGLDPDLVMNRRPHEFSGGQCQRIAIARALIMEPCLIICDEPVSALDVSVRAQILNLLEDMKARYGLTLLFISHDLAVVKNISDRVAVMYLGRLCELASSERLYEAPLHPYTAALMAAIPVMDPDRGSAPLRLLVGELPSPINPPSGCRFRTRCPRAATRCAELEPKWREAEPDHFVACHFPLDHPSE
ncbi:ATP-binding cassette domain-containing protein [Rhodopseudomonas boonkerdii]|uniref:ABC transporter ATP-binding protein n=1 Tax=Rhodopseudomonas boonkerdii TaxID=475937 RepID=UPI001E624D23|nr:oligopeptide/dipeptide ABC transporter ATP-binding protein [Rhodopseudomonas boonkerdii]UGV27234.1 ATP-binding cassette domain-containing protein [Rhodopseudomonas boonkerdii]